MLTICSLVYGLCKCGGGGSSQWQGFDNIWYRVPFLYNGQHLCLPTAIAKQSGKNLMVRHKRIYAHRPSDQVSNTRVWCSCDLTAASSPAIKWIQYNTKVLVAYDDIQDFGNVYCLHHAWCVRLFEGHLSLALYGYFVRKSNEPEIIKRSISI